VLATENVSAEDEFGCEVQAAYELGIAFSFDTE
jgi:hypothetical protein